MSRKSREKKKGIDPKYRTFVKHIYGPPRNVEKKGKTHTMREIAMTVAFVLDKEKEKFGAGVVVRSPGENPSKSSGVNKAVGRAISAIENDALDPKRVPQHEFKPFHPILTEPEIKSEVEDAVDLVDTIDKLDLIEYMDRGPMLNMFRPRAVGRKYVPVFIAERLVRLK